MEVIKKSDAGKKFGVKMKYTDEFLISELHRFVRENDRVPAMLNMQPKYGYPSGGAYTNHFGSWNNTLKAVGLEVNQISDRLDGSEICSHCSRHANEIPNFRNWFYYDGVRYCPKHGSGGLPDYVKGILNINSNVGRGRAGEICVVKVLKIGNEYDCNRLSCGYSFDMYNDEYGKIDVKTSVLSDKYNIWIFTFGAKKMADTYICIGMSLDTKHVEHVWIVPNVDDIRDLMNFGIVNTQRSLSNRRQWEVDVKLYNESWQEMLDNYTDGKCKIFK